MGMRSQENLIENSPNFSSFKSATDKNIEIELEKEQENERDNTVYANFTDFLVKIQNKEPKAIIDESELEMIKEVFKMNYGSVDMKDQQTIVQQNSDTLLEDSHFAPFAQSNQDKVA